MSPKARAVVFLHCDTSELNKGGERLRKIIRGSRVLLIDMGHTHCKELANDGHTLYSTTRSTGQIEEGPVGVSVTNVDGDVVSWNYLPWWTMRCSSPYRRRIVASSRLERHRSAKTHRSPYVQSSGLPAAVEMQATFAGLTHMLHRVGGSHVFQGRPSTTAEGVYELVVTASCEGWPTVRDKILVCIGELRMPGGPRDVDNGLDVWPEHGLLGAQLGPNKNGRKW